MLTRITTNDYYERLNWAREKNHSKTAAGLTIDSSLLRQVKHAIALQGALAAAAAAAAAAADLLFMCSSDMSVGAGSHAYMHGSLRSVCEWLGKYAKETKQEK